MANNPIRPSQFIFSHGPGSVLQTTRGPVIVKDMGELFRNHVENRDVNISGEARQLSISDFEVKERRLSQKLGGVRFCRLPRTKSWVWRTAGQCTRPREGYPHGVFVKIMEYCTKAGMEGGTSHAGSVIRNTGRPRANVCPGTQ